MMSETAMQDLFKVRQWLVNMAATMVSTDTVVDKLDQILNSHAVRSEKFAKEVKRELFDDQV